MTNEPPELPLWVITSTNWTTRIRLDEYNASFDKEHQMIEAATQAIEVFQQLREDSHIVMNPESGDELPRLGTTVLVHLANTDPDKAAIIFTHVCLANMGFYKEAFLMEEELVRQIEVLRKRQEEKEQKDKRQSKMSEFTQLLKDSIPKKTRKKNIDKKKKDC